MRADIRDEHLRGRRLVSADELEELVREERPPWDPGADWGPVQVPSYLTTSHFCAIGAPGSGKTVLIRLLMQSVLKSIGSETKLLSRESQAPKDVSKPKSTDELVTTSPYTRFISLPALCWLFSFLTAFIPSLFFQVSNSQPDASAHEKFAQYAALAGNVALAAAPIVGLAGLILYLWAVPAAHGRRLGLRASSVLVVLWVLSVVVSFGLGGVFTAGVRGATDGGFWVGIATLAVTWPFPIWIGHIGYRPGRSAQGWWMVVATVGWLITAAFGQLLASTPTQQQNLFLALCLPLAALWFVSGIVLLTKEAVNSETTALSDIAPFNRGLIGEASQGVAFFSLPLLLYVAYLGAISWGQAILGTLILVFIAAMCGDTAMKASALARKEPVPEALPSRAVPPAPTKLDGHRALIYDAKLEVLPLLSGMALCCPVISANPFDSRGAAWNMADDIRGPATAQQVAAILIPEEKNSNQPFFADASRQLLQAAMVSLIRTQAASWTFKDLLLLMKSRERLTKQLDAVPETKDISALYLHGDERTVTNIMATLQAKLGPYDVVAAAWGHANDQFSLQQWIRSESILVLANDESFRSVLDPINRVLFKRAVELTLAQPETETGRTWFFLDEVREAGNLDALGRLMTKGRSVGASVVLGFQDIQGMRDAFGKEAADEIIGLCANKAILRLESPETAEWASKVLGEFELTETKTTVTEGSSQTRGESTTKGWNKGWSSSFGQGSSTNRSGGKSGSKSLSTSESTSESTTVAIERKKREAALASEFMSLPPTTVAAGLSGYFLTRLGATRTTIRGFERKLAPVDSRTPRVSYRDEEQQYLRRAAEDEQPAQPKSDGEAPAAAAASFATLPPPLLPKRTTWSEPGSFSDRLREVREQIDRGELS